MEQIKIGFKTYSLTWEIQNEHRIVIHKDKKYEYIHFDELEEYKRYIEVYNSLNKHGITIPKIVSKSKKELIIIRQYIDKENCLIDLSKNELEEKAIELLFNMYRFARLYKFDLDYHPDNYCYKDGKLYYLLNEMYKKDPKHSLEEEGLFYWINSSTLNNYLIDHNLPKLEHVLSKAEANKKVVLLGVKYW